MLYAVFKQSVKENFRVGRILPWVILAALAGCASLFIISETPEASNYLRWSIVTAFFSFHIVSLAAAIVVSAIINAEVEQKTIVYLLTRPIPRWTLLVGRWLGTTLTVSVIGWLAVICSALPIYGAAALGQPVVLRDLLAVLLGTSAYSAVFLLTSLMSNRALLINLLLAFGWELSVPALPGSAYKFSVVTYMLNLHSGGSSAANAKFPDFLSSMFQGSSMSPILCGGVLIAIAAVCIAVSVFWFSVFEYLPKEQSA